ncbi:type II secretion system minor pseudopilin GspJ [Solimonas marina]|uniref:Type II secretion system protein J n=1 Tax=Solimonas marina TaxID=2714601 RepID=A0A969WBN0_9GAMM|nr:type II secretion system minor pseudopilin GspJ [Solimonas marina]NKF23140.1 type II secretion system minor pseudopilin GspJ [Solimonas marina]
MIIARQRPPIRQRGFTLLEIIIVVAIFAIFAVLAYGGLDSVLQTRTRVEAAQQRLAEVQKAYVRLRDDFQQVRDRPVRDNYGDTEPGFEGADNAAVEFTRGGWPNPLYLPRASLQRVSYRLEDGALHRLSWRILDRAQDTQPVDLVLLTGVTDLQWRFMDQQRQWQTRWPSLNTATTQSQAVSVPPPLGIEISLTTKDYGKLRFLFRLGVDPVTFSNSTQTTTTTTTTTETSQ